MRSMTHALRRHSLRLLTVLTMLIVVGNLAAATLCVNPRGRGGCKSSIAAAVAAASPGDTIQVEQGSYTGPVTITKSLSLIASPGARPSIDASRKSNGILVSGISTSPNPGVMNVIVSGFDIHDANFEGILVVNASNVTLLGNHVHDNNKSLDPSAAMCPNIPAFETSEAMDCGEGIHLMAVDHSFVIRNLVENNSGGILITDETGPTTANLVKENVVRDNGYACGITMASHPAANASGPIMAVNYGISHNVISHNDSHHNGLAIPGAGAGVGIFAPGPGSTNIANVVIGNELHDNGLPGVTMHNHASVPGAPPIYFGDNVIVGNHIYGNAADTEDAKTSGPTGINIYSLAPINGTVVAQNDIRDEAIAIAFNAPAGSTAVVHFNDFNGRFVGIDNIGSGSIDATNNWWDCPGGPIARCSRAIGNNISTTPALTRPFDLNYNW
ncbi:right-handed parallel beta-helix repeat-containing protein [Silvibacterium acidisoli]|uniref:right-handed parallel beta-helix repeat-containing protein n=1 Tax=Acidobacteriaceae bacterium ZG23-2 TaxID=2883246 RepID=UPI00406C772D